MKHYKRKAVKLFGLGILLLGLCGIIIGLSINYYMIYQGKDTIYKDATKDTLEFLNQWQGDCILVLGAGLKEDGTPNYMLQDRLDKALELYNQGVCSKILLTGDNGQEAYDEVNAMKDYMVAHQVPLENLYLDHAGFSTYDSIFRAKEIFMVERVIIISQEYHLYRAVYLGNKLGIESIGIASKQVEYPGQMIREVREILARNKDFLLSFWKLDAKIMGDVIPISGSALITHD